MHLNHTLHAHGITCSSCVQQVTLLGKCVSFQITATVDEYTIDDGTGKMTVKWFVDEATEAVNNLRADCSPGNYIRVDGGIRSSDGTIFLQAYSIKPITDHNEVCAVGNSILGHCMCRDLLYHDAHARTDDPPPAQLHLPALAFSQDNGTTHNVQLYLRTLAMANPQLCIISDTNHRAATVQQCRLPNPQQQPLQWQVLMIPVARQF